MKTNPIIGALALSRAEGYRHGEKIGEQRHGWRRMGIAPKDRRIILNTPAGVAVGQWLDNSGIGSPWQGWATDLGPFAPHDVTAWMALPKSPNDSKP